MHLALLNGMRVEPEKGLEGVVCPICKQPVYARCGEVYIPHWAHKSVIDCDPWQERETQWHRDWKNLFGDLQEQMHEKNGTRHMADVKTPDGTIVEFRHRRINAEGQRTRQAFFGETMFWVVDCTSNPKCGERFKDNRYCLDRARVSGHEVWSTREASKCFPRAWINCRRFVFFGFGEEDLWYIFPRRDDDPDAICMRMSKGDFVTAVKDGYAKFRERCVEVYRAVTRSRKSVFNYSRVNEKLFCPTSFVASTEAEPQSIDLPDSSPAPQNTAMPIAMQQSDSELSPEPVSDIWPVEFDKTVSLALTVDLVTGWLIANGIITNLVTDSCVEGDANVIGCCALHCSVCCSTQDLYWAKRRIENTYGTDALISIPPDIELKARAGDFIGTVEYHAEGRFDGKVKLRLRNFERLASNVSQRASHECIWRLDPSLQEQILAVE